ncbi:MAG: GlsB/YeaQ/YmgE family stress response membrane protein [Candidatus Binatia bacterium]
MEIAEAVLRYLQSNLIATLVIAVVAGFLARQTVSHGKEGNWFRYFMIGLFGSFVGQYAILYFDLKEIMEALGALRFFLDLLVAYVGSFILASILHLIKPL